MRGGRLKSQKAKNYYYNCSVCGEAILGSFRLAGTMQEKAQQNRGLARFIQKARALARVVGVVTGGPRAPEGRLPSPPWSRAKLFTKRWVDLRTRFPLPEPP